jgi:transposase
MVTPASDDLGERVALFVLSGETVRHAADVFGVSVASEVTWTERHRATGSAAARPMGGRRRDVMAPGRGSALARLAGHPSLALRALQAELTERGVVVSCGAVWHVRARRSPQPQKDCSASEVHRPEIARKRARRRRHQDRIDPAHDQTWVKTDMTPCAAGHRAASAWRDATRTATGARRPSAPRCVSTLSRPPVSSTDRSTAKASPPGSNTPRSRRSGPAPSSSSTIPAATRDVRYAPRSETPGRICSSCRPAHPTSTPSKWSSPRSRPCSGKPMNAASKPQGEGSEPSSILSHPSCAKPTFGMPAMFQCEADRLWLFSPGIWWIGSRIDRSGSEVLTLQV